MNSGVGKKVQRKRTITTVKLGNNELGYNEPNEHDWLVLVILMEIFLGYNEQNRVITNRI